MDDFKVGDKVYLKSGSDPLTVVAIESYVVVEWENNGRTYRDTLPGDCLTKEVRPVDSRHFSEDQFVPEVDLDNDIFAEAELTISALETALDHDSVPSDPIPDFDETAGESYQGDGGAFSGGGSSDEF